MARRDGTRMAEALDSRFELVVIEGGGQGGRHYLNRNRVTLGRHDPGDEAQPGVLAFPEPTVSRVHAVLEWDPRKHRFLLIHRSRTNHTILNGTDMDQPQLLQAGDKIKLGRLVLEVRQVDPREAPVEEAAPEFIPDSGYYLVALLGPSRGELYPLNYTQLMLCEPPAETTTRPGIYVPSIGDVRATVLHQGSQLFIESKRGERPLVIRSQEALTSEWVVGTDAHFALFKDDLLVCGKVVFLCCDTVGAGRCTEAQENGQLDSVHPLLAQLHPDHDPVLEAEEPHKIRILSGSLRGSHVWVRPEKLTAPLSIGKAGGEPAPLISLPDKTAGRLEIDFEPDRLVVRNTDETVRITHNWDLLTPGEESYAVSGDRFVLGRTVVRYENSPIQSRADRLSIAFQDQELPLLRQENVLGYRTESDLRIDDRRLSPSHAVVRVDANGAYYRHQHKEAPARLNSQEIKAGQELPLNVEDEVEILSGLTIRLIERTLKVDLTEPMLIGPTQAEIDASRGSTS